MMKGYPRHMYTTKRNFMRDKRRHLRAALKAMDEVRIGCAYMPDADFDSAPRILDGIVAKLRELYRATMAVR